MIGMWTSKWNVISAIEIISPMKALLGTLTKPNVAEHTQDNNSWVSMAADELRMRLLLCQRSIHSFPTHYNSNMSHMYGRH